MSYVELAKHYAGEIKMPSNKQEGLANAVKMIIHAIARDDVQEAVYQLAGLLDDVQSSSNPYRIEAGPEVMESRNYLPQYDPEEDGDYSDWLVFNNID